MNEKIDFCFGNEVRPFLKDLLNMENKEKQFQIAINICDKKN